MSHYRPRRSLVEQALKLVRTDPKRGEATVPSGENGITPDTVLLLIATVNKLRDARREAKDLRALVERVCARTPFDRARQYAYEIVIMRYYSLLAQFASRSSSRWKSRGRRPNLQEMEEPFRLVPPAI